MKPNLRLSMGIAALSTVGFVLAAPGDPPTDGIDLGAMKLKSRPSAPVGNVVGSPASAPTPALKATGTPRGTTPSAIGASAPAQNATQSTAAPGNPATTAQSGIGNIVQSPIGTKKAIDILGSPAPSRPAQASEDASTDVKVKMPSMFRK